MIHSLLVDEIQSKQRVLVSCDFAYGFPVDFAATLQVATGKSDRVLPWLMVWQLHAEIYPSFRDPLPDEIKDRGQVRAMWQWARDLDRGNLLWREFCRPIEVETGSKEDMAIQLTAGWILGSSPIVINQ